MPRGKKPRTQGEILLRLFFLFCGTGALGVVAFFAVFGAWHMFEKERDATAGYKAAQAQLELAEEQKTTLENQVSELATPFGTEAALRNRFGVVKPGEGIIEVVPTPASTTLGAAAGRSWWKKLVSALWP